MTFYLTGRKSEAELDCEIDGGKFIDGTYCAITTEKECSEFEHKWDSTKELCFDNQGQLVIAVEKIPMSEIFKGIDEDDN